MTGKEKPRRGGRGSETATIAVGEFILDLYSSADIPKNQLSTKRRVVQLQGELEELNEALKHGDPNVDSGWLDAYDKYLEVSAELVRLKAAVRDAG